MRISKITPNIDRKAIARTHEFWELRADDGRLRHATAVLDLAVFGNEVEAVCRRQGGKALLMIAKGACSRQVLGSAVAMYGDEGISYSPIPITAISDRDLLMLLLCSLARSRFGSLACSNLTGRLLVVCPKHVQSRNDVVRCVHAIEIAVDKDFSLALHVRTFSSLSLAKYMKGGPTLAKRLPKYVLTGGKFLKRVLPSEDNGRQNELVERSVTRSRYRIPFLDITSEEAFLSSKVGVLDEVLQRLGERYGGYVQLTFDEVPDSDRIDCRTRGKDVWRESVAHSFKGMQINVVDTTGDHQSLAIKVARKTSEMFGIPANIVNSVKDDSAVLRIIHDEEYYKKDNDPHNECFKKVAVQHLTIERLGSKDMIPEAVLEGSVKELAVKHDVLEGQMTLAEWPALELGGPWTFCLPMPPDSPDGEWRYALLKVSQDGGMECTVEEYDYLGESPYQQLINAGTFYQGSIEYAMMGSGGDINLIGRTDLYGIPNHEEIASCFADGGKPSRSVEGRKRLFSDVTDIAFSKVDDCHGYYRVGIVGYGMNRKVINAAVLRKVSAMEGSKLLFPEALCLLDVDFVRTREPSITPFPLKYLREWLRANYPEIGKESSL